MEAPLLGNIIMIVALAGLKVLPLEAANSRAYLERCMTEEKTTTNLVVFELVVRKNPWKYRHGDVSARSIFTPLAEVSD